MSHVDDGQLNALLDGELSPAEVSAVGAHVASCAECARRLADARAFLAEAGELLAVLTPPVASAPAAGLTAAPAALEPPVAPLAPGPAPANPQRPGERELPGIAKTSKEVAVSVDGRTELTPAIRPVFAHEVPPAKRRWQLPGLEKLAWAASLVLAVGVGYLANEVNHQGRAGRLAETDAASGPAELAAAPAADTQREPGPRANAPVSPAARRPAVPRGADPGATGGGGAATATATRGIGAAPKPRRVTKPAPAFARPRAEELAGATPAEGRQRSDVAEAPAARAAAPAADSSRAMRESRAQAPANARALGDVTGAAAPAPSPAQGARLRSAAPAAAPAPADRDEAARSMDAFTPAFQAVRLEEAVRRLSGSIRLIDGMNPARVEVGPGRLVPGANPERDVVRVTYADLRGGQLVLDQQIGDAQQGASFNGLMMGDTLVTTSEGGVTQVRWVDRKFWLSLTGSASPDTVRALVERIR